MQYLVKHGLFFILIPQIFIVTEKVRVVIVGVKVIRFMIQVVVDLIIQFCLLVFSYMYVCRCAHVVYVMAYISLLLILTTAYDIIFKVLPSLREKHDEFLLRELVKRWANHKVMVRWLSRFFHYLDRYFIARRSLPALNEVGLTCFRESVSVYISEK